MRTVAARCGAGRGAGWRTERWYHFSSLLRAFVDGVIAADPWRAEYHLPPEFTEAVRWFVGRLAEEWPGESYALISPQDFERRVRRWVLEQPLLLQWATPVLLIGSGDGAAPLLGEREFIDLYALAANAARYLDQRSDELGVGPAALDDEQLPLDFS